MMKNEHKFTIRVERDLIQRCKIKAAMENTNISEFIRSALEDWVKDVPYNLPLRGEDEGRKRK